MPGRIVSLGGVALLIDAAVETFLAGSSLRWWPVGVVALYVAVVAFTWRRAAGGARRAGFAAAAILALVAATAWRPGGLIDGVRLLGQPTPRLMALFAGAGLALAAYVLFTARAIPAVARYVLGLLAIYGAIAFFSGAVANVPLPVLLAGASLWRALPEMLQGAFLGGVIVLPLAIAAAVISSGLRRPPAASPRADAYRIVALALSLALVLAGLPMIRRSVVPAESLDAAMATAASGQTSSIGAASTTTSAPSPIESLAAAVRNGPALSPADQLTRLSHAFRAIEDGERDAPRDRWDVAYVATHLGNDPERTFAWVRTHTFWIPYHGLLRGPAGVLMDRLGDSLDRAELLAMLFRQEGRSVRLAHASLLRAQAAKLLPSLVMAEAESAKPEAPPPNRDPWTTVAARYQLDENVLRTTAMAETNAAVALERDLQVRVDNQTKRLTAAVGPPPAGLDVAELERALAALQDHWWAQTNENGTWHDWDLANRAGDAALASPDRTIDPGNVPPEERHQIVVRVIGEQWQGGALRERIALEHTLQPADLIGTSITLRFAPGHFPKPFPPANENLVQALRQAALDEQDWTPVLTIGANHVTETALMSTGNLTMPSTYQDTVSMAHGVVKGLGQALAGAFSAPAPAAAPGAPPPAPGQFLTAAWLEYEIRVPGEAPQKIRRVVFDLLGPVARAKTPVPSPRIDDNARLARGLALGMETDILPMVCRLAPQFVVHVAAQAALADRDVIEAVVRGDYPDDFEHAEQVATRIKALPSPLYALALLRFAPGPDAPPVFIDRPNILTRHTAFEATPAPLALQIATDVVANEVGVTPGVPAFAARMRQGVLDTNAEARYASSRPSANAGWAFDAGTWTAVTSRDDPRFSTVQRSADVRQRMAGDLAAGFDVVAPVTSVAVGTRTFAGWWRVDPRTGDALGLGETGWGDAMPGYSILLMSVLTAAATGFLFNYVACQGLGASPGPVAAWRGTPPLPAGRRHVLDQIVAPVEAASACLGGAVKGAIFGALMAFAAVAPIGGAPAPEPSPNGGQDMGAGSSGPAGGNGEPAGGGSGSGPEPGGGGGGTGGGGNGSNGGGNDGSGSGGTGGGSGGGSGAGTPVMGSNPDGSMRHLGDNPAMDDAEQRWFDAEARDDQQGMIDALHDMMRSDPNYPAGWKGTLGVNPGLSSSGTTGTSAGGASAPISPKAISVNPCAPNCVVPIDESAGGLDQTLQVLGDDK